jgi:hypothetical protein
MMAKIAMIAAFSAVLLRFADNYFYCGKYTDAFMFMARDMLRWFGW